jgi:hypothetical protein
MTNTLLISWAKVAQYSDINNNLDANLIKNNIRESQDIELQRVIGTSLYNKLIDLVEQGTINDSGNADYKTLLDDYVQDMLLYSSYFYILESSYIRTRNDGLLIPQGGENTIAVDRTVYEMKRKSCRNKFEYYSDRLSRFINEKQGSYPELNDNDFLYQQQPDYGTQFTSPVVFSQNTRGTFYNWAKKYGIKVTDSAYPAQPPQ